VTKPSPRPLDYWDVGEEGETDHETPAGAGSPAEVHHSLDDPAPQTSTSVPTTRFRRVRSTPARPEEETDENP
ncbi:MAG: hypothetical protein ACRDN0_26390, partial [Trebonia sp.]